MTAACTESSEARDETGAHEESEVLLHLYLLQVTGGAPLAGRSRRWSPPRSMKQATLRSA